MNLVGEGGGAAPKIMRLKGERKQIGFESGKNVPERKLETEQGAPIST